MLRRNTANLTNKSFIKEAAEQHDTGNTQHEYRARSTILGQSDGRMGIGMQMIERMFERAIEQFGGEHQAAIEQQKGPPNGRRP